MYKLITQNTVLNLDTKMCIPFDTFIMNTIYTTEVFDTWFESLADKQTARRIQARIDRAEEGNFGDHKTQALALTLKE